MLSFRTGNYEPGTPLMIYELAWCRDRDEQMIADSALNICVGTRYSQFLHRVG